MTPGEQPANGWQSLDPNGLLHGFFVGAECSPLAPPRTPDMSIPAIAADVVELRA